MTRPLIKIRNKINLIITYLIDELDIALGLLGVLFSLILTIMINVVIGHPMYTMVALLSFMSFTIYLFIRKYFYPLSNPFLNDLRKSTRFYVISNMLFFILLFYSIISIYLRPDPYIRPLGYFISTALMAALVANEIIFLSPQKSQIYLILLKIIMIGLSLVYSQILIFPSVVGIDPGWHRWFTLKILRDGYVPDGLSYSNLPLMHLMIGMISLITNLGYKIAAMYSISSVQVICDALFIFLLGKVIISTKIGLLAALLLEVANYHILFSWWAIPNTLAATLTLPILFIILKQRMDKSFSTSSLILFLMGTLIITHSVTAMFLAVLLFIFKLSSQIYTKFLQQNTGQFITWTICILFSTMMLAYWSYISGHILILAELIKFGFRDPLPSWMNQSFNNIPILEQIFNYLGLFLFLSLSFIGSLYMISKNFRNIERFAYTVSGFTILGLSFFPLIMGIYIISNRWHYFSQILLTIPLSVSIILIIGIFKSGFIKSLLVYTFFFSLTALLIISPIANIDNFVLSPNMGIRIAFTESEMSGASFTTRNSIGMVSSDFQYIRNPSSSIFANYYNMSYDRILSLEDSLYIGNFSRDGSLKIIRKEIIGRTFYISRRRIYRLDYDPNIILSNFRFNKIYDNSAVTAYR